MPHIRKFKDAVGKRKPDKSEAQQTTSETKSTEGAESDTAEFEAGRKRLREALDALRSKVAKAKKLAVEKKAKIRARFDALHIRSTSGKTEAPVVYQTGKDGTQGSIERELSASMREIERAIEELLR